MSEETHEAQGQTAPPDAAGPGDGTQSGHPDAPGSGHGTAPVADAVSKLTADAQRAANNALAHGEQMISELRALANVGYDAGETGLGDLFRIVDDLGTIGATIVKEVSDLSSGLVGQVAGKLGASN